MEHSADYFDPYEEWKHAMDFACMVPLALYEFPGFPVSFFISFPDYKLHLVPFEDDHEGI